MKKVVINSVGFTFSSNLCLGLVFILSIAGFGQTVRNTDYKADQSLKSNARVNPSTLAMELSIPIGGYMGRAGNGLPIVFNYSSKVWQIYAPPLSSWESNLGIKTDTTPMYAKRTAAGWSSNLAVPRIDYTLGIYEGWYQGVSYEGQAYAPVTYDNPGQQPTNYPLYYVKRVQIVMPDGSTHEFRKDDTIYSYGTSLSVGGAGLPDQTGTFLSVDGSRMRLELGEQSSTLYMSDGNRYLFGARGSDPQNRAHTFIDKSGNKMTYDAANKRWTDTIGRTVTDPMPMNWDNFEQAQTYGDQTATFPGLNGTLNVTFSWRYLKDPNGGESGLEDTSQNLHYLSNKRCAGSALYDINGLYLFNNPEPSIVRVCGVTGTSQGSPPNPIVLTKITLPNGQKYEFKYNVYGEIIKIIYPTGAYERFLYGQVASVQSQGASYDQAGRGVLERWVSSKGDGTDELHWTYYNSTITSQDGIRTQQFLYTETLGAPQPYGFGDAKTGSPYEERVLAPLPSNQILRRKLTGYEVTGAQTGGYSGATRDLRPTKEVTIIFDSGATQALAQMTETVYDTNTDLQYFAQLNPKQIKTYNYIVLDLTTAQTANIDTISALFTSSSLANIMEVDYLYDANYKARNISGIAVETRVRDAGGNVKAKSQISYDEGGYSVLSTGIMPSGATNSWLDPTVELGSTLGSKRGFPTSVKNYWDVNQNQYVETHSFYDQYGNLRKARDAGGNDTETEYDDDYAFAYPTLVKSPVPDPSGVNGSNTAFVTTISYDTATALPLTTTDENGQVTTMEYNDSLFRPTRIIAPNGSQTIIEYDNQNGKWVKTKTQIDSINWKIAIAHADGLGRSVKSESVENGGNIFTETEYDNLGRIKKASNPYRTSEIKSWTETVYDEIGRPKELISPDGTKILKSYGLATSGSHIGMYTTITDQAGKLKRIIKNALNQIIRVDEPDNLGQLGSISNANQPTTYEYNTLNKLTKVTQDIQVRTFNYDALSRLKQATNPESGTINYQYNLNGNLIESKDARNVIITYAYDNLGRMITRTYSDGTPPVTYVYDNPSIQLSKGKLTKMTSSVSTTEYTGFDNMGRITSHKQTTDGQIYTTSYTYDISGALIEQTYPSGRVVRNVLDNNGDLSIIQSKKNQNSGFWNYASHFSYLSSGSVKSMQLGNGRWESTQFNTRLQPTQVALGVTENATNLLKLNYDYGTADNNGNIKSQTLTVPTVGTTTGFTAIQTYTYDSLNRLKDAKEMIGTTQTWKQTYLYDRYGNRNFDTTNNNTTTLPQGCPQAVCNPTIDTSNNRFAAGQGYSYDLSGNTTYDAENRQFIYNGENKQIEVKNAAGNTIGQYFYDGDGRRVKKYVPSTQETTIFVYNKGGQLVAEYSTQISQTPQVSYLTADHLGSPRAITDRDGKVTSRRDFYPFGEEIATPERVSEIGYNSDNVREKFTGYKRDGEIELDFAQARYFNYEHGRFMSPDDFLNDTNVNDPMSWNLYAYGRNNPLRYVDPTGEKIEVRFIDENGNEVTLIYKNGKLYHLDGKTVYTGNNEYALKALNFLNTLRGHPILRMMIDDLVRTNKVYTIMKHPNVPLTNQFLDTANGGIVYWSGEDKKIPALIDNQGNEVGEGRMMGSIFLLAHELLGHGWFAFKGIERKGGVDFFYGNCPRKVCTEADKQNMGPGAVQMNTFGAHELDAVSVQNIALVFLGEEPVFTYGGNDVSDLVFNGGTPRGTTKPVLKGTDGKPVPKVPKQKPVLKNSQIIRSSP